jgi:hypothetical protein
MLSSYLKYQRCEQNKRRHWRQTGKHNSIYVDIYWWHCNGVYTRMENDFGNFVDFSSYFHIGRPFYQSKKFHGIF